MPRLMYASASRRIQVNDLPEVLDRLPVRFLVTMREGPLIENFRVRGVELLRLVEVDNRLIVLSGQLIRDAPIQIADGIRGVESDCLAVVGLGQLEAPCFR